MKILKKYRQNINILTLQNEKKLISGFTLVELVVVMGIIGLLTSVILTQVLSAVSKGSDTAIKGDLQSIQTSAVLEFLNLGRKFSNTGIAIAGVDCSVLSTAGTMFQNVQIQKALADIKDQNRGIAPTCSIKADGTAYAIAVTLATPGKFWCIDSTGVQKGTYTTGTTDYIGQVGAGINSAVYNGLATVCN